MARGDIITSITNELASGGVETRQPGSGIEEMFLDGGSAHQTGSTPNVVQDFTISRTDGTNSPAVEPLTGGAARIYGQTKHVWDNTNYFRFQNNNAASGDVTWSQIVIG